MYETDNYIVRVTSIRDDPGSFTWELCRADSLLVLHRSMKTFPTRIEALFDSAQSATLLAQRLKRCPPVSQSDRAVSRSAQPN
jgi:cystathionine beta-lyase/cystathionine gamma-synthase